MSDATPAGDTTKTETETRHAGKIAASEPGYEHGFGSEVTAYPYVNKRLGEFDTKADADHAVACWNACEGINPRAVPELLAACKALYAAETFAMNEGVTIDDHIRRDARIAILHHALTKANDGNAGAARASAEIIDLVAASEKLHADAVNDALKGGGS